MIKLNSILENNNSIVDFASKRLKGAATVAKNAKEKGGASILTYHHFVVKLPYYKKVIDGILGKRELESEYQKVSDWFKEIQKIGEVDQIEFQRMIGKIEVLAELLIYYGDLNEDLRKWFGKGKTGSATGGGWDRYNTKGEKVGKCGDSEEGDPYAACLSQEKSKKLGKDGIASFVKRKRAAQKKAGDAKKGGESKKGQKPTFVKTGVSESSKENTIKELDKLKSDLLKKVKVLVAKKNKLYSKVDITTPMAADEKKLDSEIANLYSQINQIIKKKRNLKEGWSQKYKNSIDCDNPKGFSQKAHCAGKKR